MIIQFTEKERITLLGLLEDIAQEDGVTDAFSIQERLVIFSIIRKLGGSFFGKLITKDQLFFMYGMQEDSSDGETI